MPVVYRAHHSAIQRYKQERSTMSEIASATLPVLLTEVQVSEATGVSIASLKTERCRGTGMPYVKLGRRVRYRVDDVAAYITAHTVTPEPTVPQPD
jgi:hypothetical protein